MLGFRDEHTSRGCCNLLAYQRAKEQNGGFRFPITSQFWATTFFDWVPCTSVGSRPSVHQSMPIRCFWRPYFAWGPFGVPSFLTSWCSCVGPYFSASGSGRRHHKVVVGGVLPDLLPFRPKIVSTPFPVEIISPLSPLRPLSPDLLPFLPKIFPPPPFPAEILFPLSPLRPFLPLRASPFSFLNLFPPFPVALSPLSPFLPDLLPFLPKIFPPPPFLPKIFPTLSLLRSFPPFPSQGLSPPESFSLFLPKIFSLLSLLAFFLPFLPKIFPPPQFLVEIIYFPPFPSKGFSHPQFFSLFLPKIFPPLSSLSPFP